MDHCVVKTVTPTHDLPAIVSLGRTAFYPPPHLPCVTLTVAVTHIAVVSTSNCLTFCTLNDFIAIEQPDQNAKITSYLEF